MMKLSIIVPVYNVEAWLERCLNSLLSIDLSYKDFEIIAVNDGSTDQSLNVLKVFVQKHQEETPEIKIVNQNNAGLSAARNKGLSIANGDYIWFVDSDDYIEASHVKMLVERCVKQNLDILCFGLQLVYDNDKIEPFLIKDNSNGSVLIGSEFLCNVDMPPAAWCAIYRREFLLNKKLLFMEGILHEDQEFTPRAYYLAQRIMFKQVIVYNYVQREGSIMKNGSRKEKKAKDLLKVADSLYAFVNKNVQKGSDAYDVMMDKIAFVFGQSLRNFTDASNLSEYEFKPYYPLVINRHTSFKERIKYTLMNKSLRLYLFIYHYFNIK